ncbi:gephyrin-like molybdotransferase Glp [Gayadomonas joobiniege]|uniref:molybdopterin molybdotransferase MoeA n=1 Tax=Gayadomonas joobiniege TaxID=1234606 RepID=UPI00037341EE|nr:gephyrin-like molybdotransferase Glp [Gayadomonas joobiniege]
MRNNNTSMTEISVAKQQMLAAISTKAATRTLAVIDSLNQILAESVYAKTDNPPYDNSAMDGYALAKKANADGGYHCIVTVYAGQNTNIQLQAGQCARIMTGAQVPSGSYAVVMQEKVSVDGENIYLKEAVPSGNNIRCRGEDFLQEQVLFTGGHKIQPQDIALMVAAGVETVKVFKPLTVAVVTTGNELKEVGTKLEPGQIYDSNRPMLTAYLKQQGFDVRDYGCIEDNPERLSAVLQLAAAECDAIVSSGGVSVGDADYTGQVLEQIGQVNFYKVAIKPGKPFTFGQIGEALFFGLPGNPVSAAVTFQQLALAGLLKAAGQQARNENIIQLPLAADLSAGKIRLEYIRALFIYQNNLISAVKPLKQQGSGALTSLTGYDCFILRYPKQVAKAKGELVEVLLK